ncbi:MAG: XdhC family protein [Chloroflexi bacterium]|nr:MAG: XdhC family protein [Chloroflexota bacterium]MBL1195936.1 XdhC family protein [Chloroflexota bacterium]NOH13229.1 XdhC family protein [Chloroflexota bacterium]
MSIYQRIAEIENNGGSAALCTITQATGSTPRNAGSKMLVFPDGSIEGTIGGGEMESLAIQEARSAMQDGKTRLVEYSLTDPQRGDPGVCGGQMEVYVEPITPHPTVIVVGAGHVGQAVVHLAKWLGFRVVISDDREEFVTGEMTPDADEHIAGILADLPEAHKITSQSYIIMTTRNVKVDVEGLPALLDTPAAYIGVIGSKRRWETAQKMLVEKGISKDKLERVVSPMGLELNAETPEEIAVSIMAEVLMLRGEGDGHRMAGG